MLVAVMDSLNSCDPAVHISCGKALQACCKVLGHLAMPHGESDDPACCRINSECAETVAAAGGATAVVAAMRDHSASEAVAASGCGALCNIGLSSMQAASSVVAAGGLLAVSAALRMHWASVPAPVAGYGVRALACILANVIRRGDITFIVPCFKEAIDDGCLPVLLAVLCSRRSDPTLQHNIPVIMSIFAESSPENRAAVVAAGGVRTCLVRHALPHHS